LKIGVKKSSSPLSGYAGRRRNLLRNKKGKKLKEKGGRKIGFEKDSRDREKR